MAQRCRFGQPAAAFPPSFSHVGFPRSREYRKNRRMDSRLHGNDGKAPDMASMAKKIAHPPSVIPAEAGIHLLMARGGWDTYRRMDARMDSRFHGNDERRGGRK